MILVQSAMLSVKTTTTLKTAKIHSNTKNRHWSFHKFDKDTLHCCERLRTSQFRSACVSYKMSKEWNTKPDAGRN